MLTIYSYKYYSWVKFCCQKKKKTLESLTIPHKSQAQHIYLLQMMYLLNVQAYKTRQSFVTY